ncbi:MAG: CorA family divalent cation transporter, partial [Clostridia bacterium]
FGLVNIVDVNAVFSESDRLAFFFRKNLFLVVNLFDSDGSTRESFMATLRRYRPETVTLEKLIFALLENGISHDGRELDIIEHDIALLEESVVHNPVDRSLNARLYEHKRRLMVLRSYYEQLIDIGEELEENENDIFEEESLHYFGLLTAKAQRLSSAVSMLCDELNQLREAHEAAMEYSLNNLMKVFTVITIIFLPLTLMTGWFGMNFTYMPSLDSPIGYPLFIVTCVAIVIVTLCFFKRKGYFK